MCGVWRVLCGVVCGVLCGVVWGVLCGVVWGVLCGVVWGVLCGVVWGVSRDDAGHLSDLALFRRLRAQLFLTLEDMEAFYKAFYCIPLALKKSLNTGSAAARICRRPAACVTSPTRRMLLQTDRPSFSRWTSPTS